MKKIVSVELNGFEKNDEDILEEQTLNVTFEMIGELLNKNYAR